MTSERRLSYDEVRSFMRTYRNGHEDEVPYDINGAFT
jgi:hypothetical protein